MGMRIMKVKLKDGRTVKVPEWKLKQFGMQWVESFFSDHKEKLRVRSVRELLTDATDT